jgi:hypothetical protein
MRHGQCAPSWRWDVEESGKGDQAPRGPTLVAGVRRAQPISRKQTFMKRPLMVILPQCSDELFQLRHRGEGSMEKRRLGRGALSPEYRETAEKQRGGVRVVYNEAFTLEAWRYVATPNPRAPE